MNSLGDTICRQTCLYERSPLISWLYSTVGTRLVELIPSPLKPQAFASRYKLFAHKSLVRYVTLVERSDDLVVRRHLMDRAVKFTIIKSCKKIVCFRNVQPVSLIKAGILRKLKFDECFVNGGEDTDLSIRLLLNGYRYNTLHFSFKTDSGLSLGKGILRAYKNTLPEILYLGYKLRSVYHLV